MNYNLLKRLEWLWHEFLSENGKNLQNGKHLETPFEPFTSSSGSSGECANFEQFKGYSIR
jgi:hypothetical protein